MYIYQAANTLLKSYNQLQRKNIHIKFFIFQKFQNEFSEMGGGGVPKMGRGVVFEMGGGGS